MSPFDIFIIVAGFACVIADIFSADRALYHRMRKAGEE